MELKKAFICLISKAIIVLNFFRELISNDLISIEEKKFSYLSSNWSKIFRYFLILTVTLSKTCSQ